MCCSDNQQVVQNELPSWLEEHYRQRARQKQGLYSLAEDIYDQTEEYTPYVGQRVQPLVSDQLTAQNMVRRNVGLNKDTPPVGADQVQAAQESMADARQRLGERFQPPMVNQENYEQPFDPNVYDAATVGDTGQFDEQAAEQYMNPYRAQVAEQVADEMRRDEQREQMRDSQAAQAAGAFGGSRQAIIDAERERNFQDQLGDQMTEIYDTGYRRAQSQFNQDRGRALEAGMADQQAQNQARQYAANTQNDAFLVNRDTFNQNQQRQLQAQQFNANMGLQGFQANRNQFNTEQDRLLQAGLGLASLGRQQQGMAQQNVNSLQSIGQQNQQMGQRSNNLQYQDFLNQRSWPYQQYSFLQGAVQGQPVDPNAFRRQTTSGGGPSGLQTAAGLGATAIGAAGAAGGFGNLFSF